MKLISKTEIYKFDISSLDPDLIADIPASAYKIIIEFQDGQFLSAKYLFDSPYSEEEWKILAMINDKIQELKKSYLEKSKC